MKKIIKKISFLNFVRKAKKIADDKKGKDIVVLNVKKMTTLANYFLIMTATSIAHTNAIVSAIRKNFKDERFRSEEGH